MRSLPELVNVPDPAWPALADVLVDAYPRARILDVDRADGERCLHRLQATARSTLGALALHTGGVTVEHGWLRILGGGGQGLPSLSEANALGEPTPASTAPALLFVAFDVLGGRFAVNGGGLPGRPGEVCYWAPDTLEWLATGLGHTEFVHWCLTATLDEFYADLRWDGWETEVAAVRIDQGLSVWPPLCTREGDPVAATNRRPVPWAELSAFLDDLATLPSGTYRFEFGP